MSKTAAMHVRISSTDGIITLNQNHSNTVVDSVWKLRKHNDASTGRGQKVELHTVGL